MRRALMLGGALIVSVAPTLATADESLPLRPIGEAGAELLAEATGQTPAGATGAQVAAADATAIMNADGSLNASKLVGMDIKSPDNETLGDIGEVVLDKDGEVRGVVVDVGGFLGIGERPVLLSWEDVTLTEQDGKATVIANVTKDRLEQMPVYDSSKD